MDEQNFYPDFPEESDGSDYSSLLLEMQRELNAASEPAAVEFAPPEFADAELFGAPLMEAENATAAVNNFGLPENRFEAAPSLATQDEPQFEANNLPAQMFAETAPNSLPAEDFSEMSPILFNSVDTAAADEPNFDFDEPDFEIAGGGFENETADIAFLELQKAVDAPALIDGAQFEMRESSNYYAHSVLPEVFAMPEALSYREAENQAAPEPEFVADWEVEPREVKNAEAAANNLVESFPEPETMFVASSESDFDQTAETLEPIKFGDSIAKDLADSGAVEFAEPPAPMLMDEQSHEMPEAFAEFDLLLAELAADDANETKIAPTDRANFTQTQSVADFSDSHQTFDEFEQPSFDLSMTNDFAAKFDLSTEAAPEPSFEPEMQFDREIADSNSVLPAPPFAADSESSPETIENQAVEFVANVEAVENVEIVEPNKAESDVLPPVEFAEPDFAFALDNLSESANQYDEPDEPTILFADADDFVVNRDEVKLDETESDETDADDRQEHLAFLQQTAEALSAKPEAEPDADAAADYLAERYIVFALDETLYAFPAANVQEIGQTLPVTALPFVPQWFLGIANLRGDILPIVGLREFWNPTQNRQNANQKSKLLVLQSKTSDVKVGLQVDAVREMRRCAKDEISRAAESAEPHLAAFQVGKVNYHNTPENSNQSLWLLDAEKLLETLKNR